MFFDLKEDAGGDFLCIRPLRRKNALLSEINSSLLYSIILHTPISCNCLQRELDTNEKRAGPSTCSINSSERWGARRPGDVCLAPTVAERRMNPWVQLTLPLLKQKRAGHLTCSHFVSNAEDGT